MSLRLRDDRKDVDRSLFDVIENPLFVYSQTVFGALQTPKALDTALADLRGFVSEMSLDGIPNPGPHVGAKPLDLLEGCWRHDDLKGHAG